MWPRPPAVPTCHGPPSIFLPVCWSFVVSAPHVREAMSRTIGLGQELSRSMECCKFVVLAPGALWLGSACGMEPCSPVSQTLCHARPPRRCSVDWVPHRLCSPCTLTSGTESQDVLDTQPHPSYSLSRGPGSLRTISMGPADTQPASQWCLASCSQS